MGKDDILVINAAQMKTRQHTTKSGAAGRVSTVVTMTVTSEPITYNVTPAFLLKNAAAALAKQIREQTQAISAPVKPSTLEARGVAERAFAKGKPWALKRFSGGRTGVTPPKVGEVRMFNHSGRLAESIVARYQEKAEAFYINYAANRWNPQDFKSAGHMEAMFQRWVSLVPALSQPSADTEVQRAFRMTHSQMVEKHKAGTTHRQATSKLQTAVKILQAAASAVA